MYMCIYVYIYVSACAYIYIYIHTHIQTFIHVHVCIYRLFNTFLILFKSWMNYILLSQASAVAKYQHMVCNEPTVMLMLSKVLIQLQGTFCFQNID